MNSVIAALTPRPGLGLLLLRVVTGTTFLLHGIDKVGDQAGTERFFASLGIPAPGLMTPFVTGTEIIGGALLIAGVATRLAGLALAIDMVVALLTAHLGNGFFASDGGIELELLLGGSSLAVALLGAGRFSGDAVLVPLRAAALSWLRDDRSLQLCKRRSHA